MQASRPTTCISTGSEVSTRTGATGSATSPVSERRGVPRPARTNSARWCAMRTAQGLNVRVAGSGHSFTPVALTNGLHLTLANMTGVRHVDHERRRVTAAAGTTINELVRALKVEGLSMINQGDIDSQALAGALTTGTHGTGVALGQPCLLGGGDEADPALRRHRHRRREHPGPPAGEPRVARSAGRHLGDDASGNRQLQPPRTHMARGLRERHGDARRTRAGHTVTSASSGVPTSRADTATACPTPRPPPGPAARPMSAR
jgi:hypothetical protein